MPLKANNVYFNTDEAVAITTNYTTFTGFWLHETAGAACTVKFYDGATAVGDPILIVSLPLDGSTGYDFVTPLRIVTGIYVDVTAGAVEGGVRVA